MTALDVRAMVTFLSSSDTEGRAFICHQLADMCEDIGRADLAETMHTCGAAYVAFCAYCDSDDTTSEGFDAMLVAMAGSAKFFHLASRIDAIKDVCKLTGDMVSIRHVEFAVQSVAGILGE